MVSFGNQPFGQSANVFTVVGFLDVLVTFAKSKVVENSKATFRGMSEFAFQLSDKKEAPRNSACCSSPHLIFSWKLILLAPLLLLHVVRAQDEVVTPPNPACTIVHTWK